MKRNLAILLSLIICLLSGCQSVEESAGQPMAEIQTKSIQEITASVSTLDTTTAPAVSNETVTTPTEQTLKATESAVETTPTTTKAVSKHNTTPTEELIEKPSSKETTPVLNNPSYTSPTVPETEPTVTVPPQPETKPSEPEPTQPTTPEAKATEPTAPTGCSHDWACIHHDEVGHWKAGIICDCGWTVYGSSSEVVSNWNNHSASYPLEESFLKHGGYGSADEWIVDKPAYDEWVCSHCGEKKS